MKRIKYLALAVMPLLASCAGPGGVSGTSYWSPSGEHIYNNNDGNVGIGTTGPESKLTVVDEDTNPSQTQVSAVTVTTAAPINASAVYAATTNANGVDNFGGYFTGAGSSGGVFGKSTDSERGTAGGVFHSAGKQGKGVIGLAYNDADNASNVGGWFDARGKNGIGIYSMGGANGYAARFIGNVQIARHRDRKVVLELGEGLDVAEGFEVSKSSLDEPVAAGTVLIIDPAHPGRLTVGNSPYDSRVAGIVAGGKDLESGVRLGSDRFSTYVALAGRVYCNVDTTNEGVQPGDLLTTSSNPGYAMRASDLNRRPGAILGKAMEGLKKGHKGKILVLVTLQ